MTAARPGPLWYYEEMSMTGRWSPVVASARPDTVVKEGQQREKRATSLGRRIRAVQRVPAHMLGLTLNELHARLTTEATEVPEDRTAAMEAAAGGAG